MKRVIIVCVVLLASVVGVAAQESKPANSFFENMSRSDYNRVYVGYNPMKINWQDNDTENFEHCPLSNSINIGYLHGSNILKSLPLYIEYGAMFQYSFGKYNSKTGGTTKIYNTNTANMYSVNVPVNLSLRLGFKSNKIGILPYAGLNLRYNITGKIKKFTGGVISHGPSAVGGSYTRTYRLFDSSDNESAMGDKALNRFQVGINAGLGFTFSKFYVGVGYTGDIMKIANNADSDYVGSLGFVNISLGLSF